MAVVELNIRGVGGATPGEILDIADERHVVQVAGDQYAGLHRPRVPEPGDRVREAYEWGRLTSGGATHSVWWVLLPFSLLNVAGWMFWPLEAEAVRRKEPHRSTLWWGRLTIVAGGMALTALYALWLAVIFIDMIGVQCGALVTCAEPWYMAPLRWFDGAIAWRVTVGSVLTAIVMFVLLRFVVSTQSRLEGFEHDDAYRLVGKNDDSRLERNTDLDDMRFWYKWEEHRRLLRWHVAVVVGTIGAVFGYSMARISGQVGFAPGDAALGLAAAGVLAGVGVWLITAPEAPQAAAGASRYATQLAPRIWWTATHLAVGVLAARIAWLTTAPLEPVAPQALRLEVIAGIRFVSVVLFGLAVVLFGLLLCRRMATANAGGGRCIQALLGVVAIALAAAVTGACWLWGVAFIAVTLLGAVLYRDYQGPTESMLYPGRGFRVAGPAVAAALALYVTGAGFGALTDVIGRLTIGGDLVAEAGYNTSLVDSFVLVLAVVVLAAVIDFKARPYDARRVIADYVDHWSDLETRSPSLLGDDPVGEGGWVRSCVADRDVRFAEGWSTKQLPERERAWVRSVASMRRAAGLGRNADRLLTLFVVVLMGVQIAQVIAAQGWDCELWRFWEWSGESFTAPLFGWSWLEWLHSVASIGIVLFLFPGVWLIRTTFRNRASRRQFAKVWDVISFWPRRFHPLAAPCYAERAVPELRNRIKQHVAHGDEVVVVAHSQGTVIAYAALMQIRGERHHVPVKVKVEDEAGMARTETVSSYAEAAALVAGGASPPELPTPPPADPNVDASAGQMLQGDLRQMSGEGPATLQLAEPQPLGHVALLTYGCPLSTLYGPFFPRYFGRAHRFEKLRTGLLRGAGWQSLYRPTDYIGQRVFVPPGGKLTSPGADPADICIREARGALFTPQSHSNYELEEPFIVALDALVADMTAPQPP